MLAPSNASAVPRDLITNAGREANASPAAAALAAHATRTVAKTPLILAAVALIAVGGIFAPSQGSVPSPNTEPAMQREVARSESAEWVALAGQVVFPQGREIPERREILRTDGFVKDAECCFRDGRRLYFENVLIEAKSRGIANAVVWLRPDSDDVKAMFPAEKLHPKATRPATKEHAIEVKECQFAPRITVARAGDTLRFRNTAPLATNVKYDTTARDPGSQGGAFNVLLAANSGSIMAPGPLKRGTVADQFGSSIYPWMRGYVWVFDHPYAAITDADGRFAIPDAPAGTWRIVIWHEEFGYSGTAAGTRIVLTDRTKLKPLAFSISNKK